MSSVGLLEAKNEKREREKCLSFEKTNLPILGPNFFKTILLFEISSRSNISICANFQKKTLVFKVPVIF